MASCSELRERRADWVERAALAASFACLIHCLGLPLLFALLPALSLLIRMPETFHVWMVVIVVPMSGFALLTGRATHRSAAPVTSGAFGILLLLVGALLFAGTPADTPTTIVGSVLLAAAHLTNWRLRHSRVRIK